MKEEALKLADELDLIARMIAIGDRIKWGQDSELMENGSSMIRRLVEELDKQEYRNKHEGFSTIIDKVAPQTKPLSDEEIHDIWKSLWEGGNIGHIAYNYAKAIEERHGIK